MGKKLETEHTNRQEASEAPDYMQPYLDISDLDGMKFIEVDESLDAAYQSFFKNGDANSGLDQNDRNELAAVYENVYNWRYTPHSEEDMKKAAEKALNDLQKKEEKEAKKEHRFPKDYSNNKEYKKQFIENYVRSQQQEDSYSAAMMASLDLNSTAISMTPEQAGQMNEAVWDKKKGAETQNAVGEALEYLQSVSFEYLTRGALLMCTGGGVCRHLNLPKDHGHFYGKGEDPVINKEDCEVGDAFHITNFGTCSGANPPSERVQAEDMVTAGETGLRMSQQAEDTLDRGFKCIPEIVAPGWINTYKQTEVGDTGNEAVSTKSFLVCIHGGIIYPINSGQHLAMQMSVEDAEAMDDKVKEEFDGLCAKYKDLKDEEKELLQKLSKSRIYPAMNSYAAIGGQRKSPEMVEAQLRDNADEQKTYKNEIGFCMDRARENLYGVPYEDIPQERKKRMDQMLADYGDLLGEEKASTKYDYYAFKRRYGYNSQSAYNHDGPGYDVGSDDYADWRAARVEQKTGKEKKSEYGAWEQDVKDYGYDKLSPYQQEEFDRAGKQYGK